MDLVLDPVGPLFDLEDFSLDVADLLVQSVAHVGNSLDFLLVLFKLIFILFDCFLHNLKFSIHVFKVLVLLL